jgi:3-dehydroquinate dehydratase-1
MQCAVSIPDLALLPEAVSSGPDLLELRLDLMGGATPAMVKEALQGVGIPVILTLRSSAEGGRFEGGPGEWWETIGEFLPFGAFVDVERRFRAHAASIRARGKLVLSSVHMATMPGPVELQALYRELKSFGDIPKVVVSPADREDVLSLLSFTLHAEKPVVTSIMGERYRWARLLLPLFGSELLFCHAGNAASPGQYHVREWKAFLAMAGDEPATRH